MERLMLCFLMFNLILTGLLGENVDIVFVPELFPFEEENYTVVETIPAEVTNKFLCQWSEQSNLLEEQVTSEKLLEISRWAKEQMKGFVPPDGWVKSIPIQQNIRMDSIGDYILFSHETETGVVVPSHSSIVFRRIVLGAVYDTKLQNICKIYVTIRGWKEE